MFLCRVPTWRRPGTKEARVEPLFPIPFAYLISNPLSGCPRDRRRASYFLGPSGAPNPLPAELIEGCAHAPQPSSRTGRLAQPGDRVLVQHGTAWLDWKWFFDGSLSASGRVRVLLQVLNRLVPVEMHVTQLRYPGPAAGYQSALATDCRQCSATRGASGPEGRRAEPAHPFLRIFLC
jgi:hypothetical protein